LFFGFLLGVLDFLVELLLFSSSFLSSFLLFCLDLLLQFFGTACRYFPFVFPRVLDFLGVVVLLFKLDMSMVPLMRMVPLMLMD